MRIDHKQRTDEMTSREGGEEESQETGPDGLRRTVTLTYSPETGPVTPDPTGLRTPTRDLPFGRRTFRHPRRVLDTHSRHQNSHFHLFSSGPPLPCPPSIPIPSTPRAPVKGVIRDGDEGAVVIGTETPDCLHGSLFPSLVDPRTGLVSRVVLECSLVRRMGSRSLPSSRGLFFTVFLPSLMHITTLFGLWGVKG